MRQAQSDCVYAGGEHLLCYVSTGHMERIHCLRCLYSLYSNGVFRTEGLHWVSR